VRARKRIWKKIDGARKRTIWYAMARNAIKRKLIGLESALSDMRWLENTLKRK